MKLGEVLRSYRMHKEISLRVLADEIGISHPTLQRIETQSIHDIDYKTMMRILNWLAS